MAPKKRAPKPAAAPRAPRPDPDPEPEPEPEPEVPDRPPVDPDAHPVGIIIISNSPPSGIRFSVEKSFFKGVRGYDALPARLRGSSMRPIVLLKSKTYTFTVSRRKSQ